MAFNGYRDKALLDRAVIDRLSEGAKPKVIAKEVGVSYSTLRRRLSRHVQAIGCDTVEHAVALHVKDKIKRTLPIALQNQVELVMTPKKMTRWGPK